MKLAVRDRKRDLKVLHMRKNLKYTFTKIGEELDISKVRARQLYVRISGERTNKAMGIGE